MTILQIEHKIQNYEGWKKAFDSDPIGRQKSGVRKYRVYRPVNDPLYVIIDLEFDNATDAGNALEALHKLWGNVDGKIIFNPQARILDLAETKDY